MLRCAAPNAEYTLSKLTGIRRSMPATRGPASELPLHSVLAKNASDHGRLLTGKFARIRQ
jgi:hypothetical protein